VTLATRDAAAASRAPSGVGCSLVGMGPIAIRGLLRRRRHQLAVPWVVFALGVAIAMHHSSPSMTGMDHDAGMGAVAEMCLAVFAAVGAAVVAVALGILALGRWRPALMLAPALLQVARTPAPRGRDGPALLRLLCVCRC
jgi:hypothetical protein